MFQLILHRKPKTDITMNYIKTFALLILSIFVLTSCSEDEYFTTDVNSLMDTQAIDNNTKAIDNNTDAEGIEPTDTTVNGPVSIIIEEPNVVDIDFVLTIP